MIVVARCLKWTVFNKDDLFGEGLAMGHYPNYRCIELMPGFLLLLSLTPGNPVATWKVHSRKKIFARMVATPQR